MKLFLLDLFMFVSLANSSPLRTPERSTKSPAFFLAGDSTTAAPSGSGGGWGNGFLTTLVNGAIGTNYGHNGAKTVSFVSGGDWANVLASVTKYKDTYDPFVMIQVCSCLLISRTRGIGILLKALHYPMKRNVFVDISSLDTTTKSPPQTSAYQNSPPTSNPWLRT